MPLTGRAVFDPVIRPSGRQEPEAMLPGELKASDGSWFSFKGKTYPTLDAMRQASLAYYQARRDKRESSAHTVEDVKQAFEDWKLANPGKNWAEYRPPSWVQQVQNSFDFDVEGGINQFGERTFPFGGPGGHNTEELWKQAGLLPSDWVSAPSDAPIGQGFYSKFPEAPGSIQNRPQNAWGLPTGGEPGSPAATYWSNPPPTSSNFGSRSGAWFRWPDGGYSYLPPTPDAVPTYGSEFGDPYMGTPYVNLTPKPSSAPVSAPPSTDTYVTPPPTSASPSTTPPSTVPTSGAPPATVPISHVAANVYNPLPALFNPYVNAPATGPLTPLTNFPKRGMAMNYGSVPNYTDALTRRRNYASNLA